MHFKSLVVIACGLASFASATPADLLTSTVDAITAPLKPLFDNGLRFPDPHDPYFEQCTDEQLDKIRQWEAYAERYHILARRAVGAKKDESDGDAGLVFVKPPTGEDQLPYRGIPCQEFYDMQAYNLKMRRNKVAHDGLDWLQIV